MYEKVLQFIERGDLKQAVKVLRSVGNLKALIPKDVLGYFQLSRRVGDFHHGALQLEKLGELFPELEIEKAFFLGELGATKQAVRLLDGTHHRLSQELEIQRYLQMGNFLSVMHDYDRAVDSYRKMELYAKDLNPVLALVARLNILGHLIYSGKKVPEIFLELQEFTEKELSKYPLIQQGGFYFLSLACQQMDQVAVAQKFLQRAFSIGVEHRLRESLLLEITQFELSPQQFTRNQIAALRKKVHAQVHIVYLDQFHKILGILHESQGKPQKAIDFYQMVLFGGRPSKHYNSSSQRYQKLAGSDRVPGWLVERQLPKVLTSSQIIYNQLERRAWPLLRGPHQEISLANDGTLSAQLTLQLSKNLGFQMRDAEIWEAIWAVPFNFVSSPTVIRSSLNRWRNSNFSAFGEITQKDHRLCLKLKPGTKIFVPSGPSGVNVRSNCDE
jgi:tetratricopeptide (TPR) repeat protein